MEIETNNKLDEIIFEVINWYDDPERIKSEQELICRNIKQFESSVANDVNQYNSKLYKVASEAIKRRKAELLKQSNLLAALGVPIKQSENIPQTFTVPIQTKRITIEKPQSSSNTFIPEPLLGNDVYQQILKVCHDLGVQMERHPSLYKGKNEESLRDLFLMMLNPHFSSATGETFNKSGKTDILIRHEGKNIFVAECKFWRGAKVHSDTINQILSYLTWRDSKSAIIYFVDNKQLQPVFDAINNETPNHECYLKAKQKNDESWYNYQFHVIGDSSRGVELAILVFHLAGNDND